MTQTTINVPSLMGAIMSIGVATANSILMVTFANDQRRAGQRRPERRAAGGLHPAAPGADDRAGDDHRHAADGARAWAKAASRTRRSARAVIGGLIVATFATLFFVPVIYSLLRQKTPFAMDRDEAARADAL